MVRQFRELYHEPSGRAAEKPAHRRLAHSGDVYLARILRGEGRFKSANSGYQPLPGDVAIYRNSPVFGDHTNIVLKNDNSVLTTVGGNEANRIRVFVNRDKQYDGLLGYGVLN